MDFSCSKVPFRSRQSANVCVWPFCRGIAMLYVEAHCYAVIYYYMLNIIVCLWMHALISGSWTRGAGNCTRWLIYMHWLQYPGSTVLTTDAIYTSTSRWTGESLCSWLVLNVTPLRGFVIAIKSLSCPRWRPWTPGTQWHACKQLEVLTIHCHHSLSDTGEWIFGFEQSTPLHLRPPTYVQ